MMQNKISINRLMQAVIKPESIWKEEIESGSAWRDLLKYPILPFVAAVAVISALLTMLFGYHIPIVGVIRPTLGDMVTQAIGTVVVYTISLLAIGWFAAWLAGKMDGKDDMDRGVSMLFWVSVPSLFGQLLSPIPMVGMIIGIGLGIYSLVLFYKAIPLFLEVPRSNQAKHFILLLISSLVFSILLSATVGRLFEPTGMQEKIQKGVPFSKNMTDQGREKNAESPKSPDKYLEDFFSSMMEGDYGQDVIEKSAKDSFTPPKDNRLSKAQVDTFISLAKKVKLVQKEQARAMKKKYDKKEDQEEPSVSDIFNGFKDLSSMVTLEMKVVKSNHGNWSEYQWVKDRVREAYFTPSLNDTTQYNAKLIEPYKEQIEEIL